MKMLKGLWKYLLSGLVFVTSWMFFIIGGLSVIVLFFLWFSRIGTIFQAYPNMGFGDFYDFTHMRKFLIVFVLGFWGIIYFHYWERPKIISQIPT
jgi:hypothetical protein